MFRIRRYIDFINIIIHYNCSGEQCSLWDSSFLLVLSENEQKSWLFESSHAEGQEWKQMSLTGANLPYSQSDPRVSPFTHSRPVLLNGMLPPYNQFDPRVNQSNPRVIQSNSRVSPFTHSRLELFNGMAEFVYDYDAKLH